MNGIPPDIYRQIQEAICRPEGTVSFMYTCKELFDPASGRGVLAEIHSGGHIFRIERDEELVLHFYHSSPGTGTRVASIDLKKVPSCETLFLAFSWSPKEVNFHVGPKVRGAELVSAKGTLSKRQFKLGTDGSIYEIGGPGLQIMGVSVYRGGKPVLQPTAIEAWKETIKATEILATGKSIEGCVFETVVTNLTLAMLVTGFEAFTKKRFLEVEQEGIEPDADAVVNSFFPRRERDAGISEILKSEAAEAKRTVLQLIVDKDSINFQNYERCKLAYNKAYRILFGDLGLPSTTLEKSKKYIVYRHRIIHVSAILGMLNQPEVPPEAPVFPKKELAAEAIHEFDEFIEGLHTATLKLRAKG
jgi:hypothetical protein